MNERNPESVLVGDDTRLRLLGRLLGTPPAQAFELIRYLHSTAEIPGDVCEFGVAQGETSALIAYEISRGDKILHLFDSFAGLPAPTDMDRLKDDIFALGKIERYEGQMACHEDLAKARLASVGVLPDRYVLHKGFIEDLLTDKKGFPERVSFAFVDFGSASGLVDGCCVVG